MVKTKYTACPHRWHYCIPLFLTFVIFNFHSYNTIILSFILYHSLRPAFFLYPSYFSKRNLQGCRAEIRARACLTASRRTANGTTPHPMSYATAHSTPHPMSYAAPQALPLFVLCLNILFRLFPYFFPIFNIISVIICNLSRNQT